MRCGNALENGSRMEQSRNLLLKAGFFACPDLFLPEFVLSAREQLGPVITEVDRLPDGLVRELAETDTGRDTTQLGSLSLAFPWVRNLPLYRSAHEIGAFILGSRVRLSFDSLIVKRAGSSWTPWHQDSAYDTPPEAEANPTRFTMWIPLDPVTEESGCMVYLPHSHLRGPLRHRRAEKGQSWIMDLSEIELSAAVACPLPIGGACLHVRNVLHAARPNEGANARFAWSLNFVSTR